MPHHVFFELSSHQDLQNAVPAATPSHTADFSNCRIMVDHIGDAFVANRLVESHRNEWDVRIGSVLDGAL